MELRNLGKTNIKITPIGLGCWQFSNGQGLAGKFWPTLQDIPFEAIIRAMLEGGVNWFDTAEMYGHGASEQALARGLEQAGAAPGSVVIATKWNPIGRTARSLVRTIEDRLRYLAPYPIDLHQIHNPLALDTVRAQMEAMGRLLREGKIRAAGVSNFSAKRMREAHKILADLGYPLASNQMEYSLLNRRIERNGVMASAKELGITIIAYSPLAQGLLTGKFHDDPSRLKERVGLRRLKPPYGGGGLKKSEPVIRTLQEIARRYDTTPAAVALAWLVQFHGDTVVAIPGATQLSQAQQNVAALRLRLTPDELSALDEVSRAFM